MMATQLLAAALAATSLCLLIRGASNLSVVRNVTVTRWQPLARYRSTSQLPGDVLRFAEALSAELTAGRPHRTALVHAARGHERLLAETLGASRLGGDIADALLRDSIRAGQPALRSLAACWRVGEDTGAGLSAAIASVARAIRESDRADLELVARTAEPRATMRVLAALPLVGLVLGMGLGADPWGWLTGTALGRLMLVCGVSLQLLGVLWSRRIIRSVATSGAR